MQDKLKTEKFSNECADTHPCPRTMNENEFFVFFRFLFLIIPSHPLSFLFRRESQIANHVTERTDLPNQLIIGSQGTDIFTQELPRVNMAD